MVAMPMKIFIDVQEAAERLEELIDLAFRQDEVHVCRAGWPVARLTSFSDKNVDFPADKIAETPPEKGTTAPGSQVVEGEAVDEVWRLAARGKPRQDHELTSAHDDHFDEGGLPR
jgi:antitoxin (DNA-binding transcriptional repressor) of toxin-antitoxin stability system